MTIMSGAGWRKVLAGGAVVGAGVAGYLGLVTGAVPVDVGLGRRIRALGPFTIDIAAPRQVVFDVLAEPYLGRQTRAVAEKIRILERGTDMVLAAHRTPVRGGLVATTVETVRFTRPERVDFRLVRGPVPLVVEQFVLREKRDATELTYTGELGTDLWSIGQRWGAAVAGPWERTVQASFGSVKAEAQRRAIRPTRG
ncbi:MAG: SRPBCC family protein [Actinomycetota bacterium]|nr:SRPBCC family protein [Actinomycetota bacterium]